jgi:hypothetical protein
MLHRARLVPVSAYSGNDRSRWLLKRSGRLQDHASVRSRLKALHNGVREAWPSKLASVFPAEPVHTDRQRTDQTHDLADNNG